MVITLTKYSEFLKFLYKYILKNFLFRFEFVISIYIKLIPYLLHTFKNDILEKISLKTEGLL